jgi:uncharacterized protein (UPF0333 family)
MKNVKAFVNVAVLFLLAICSFPCFSPGMTVQAGSQSNTAAQQAAQQNVQIVRVMVKEIGENYIITSDGKTINFDSGTKVFKNLNQTVKMRTAELHYVNGRLVAIYIM